MDGKSSLIQAKIREAIDNGTLTKNSMERGLQALIDEEINQNERPANQELIQACLNLMDELNAAPNYVKQNEPHLPKLKERIRKNKIGQLALYARRVAAITVIILIGSFSASLIAGQTGLIGHPTDDEQQYQIQGYVTKTGYVAVGQSEKSEMQTTTEMASFEEAVKLLDFTPFIPKWMPDGWFADDFIVSMTPLSEQLHLTYRYDVEDESIQYDAIQYYDADVFISNYEQNSNGTVHVWNGRTVYISTNTNGIFAVWTENNIHYSISAPLNQEAIRKMIESL